MKQPTPSNVPWDFIILFFSVYSILALTAINLFPVPDHAIPIIRNLDFVVCGIFFIDFVYRFSKAPSKLTYMKWGWLDLVSSIPIIDPLRFLRFGRIFRIIRIFRGIRSAKTVLTMFFASRSKSMLAGMIIVSFITVLFGAILILFFEASSDGNLKSGEDALWWAFVTVTTVGYGDFFPVTTGGRVIAGALMVCGIGIFGTFTAFVASLFFEEAEQEDADRDEKILSAIEKLTNEVEALKAEVGKNQKTLK